LFISKKVDLLRQYTFLHNKNEYSGVPIVATNMDTIGIFDIAVEMCNVVFSFY
jgi:GMP reductase